MVTGLRLADASRRAARIRHLLTDVDGVWTDAGVYYTADGEQSLRFSRRDGLAVELLREAGIETLIVSRENSPIVQRRAEKLGIESVFLGCRDKLQVLRALISDGAKLAEFAFIGDDVNDIDLLRIVRDEGLTAAPRDAMPVVRRVVHYVCANRGGHGAFREFADWILSLRSEEKMS